MKKHPWIAAIAGLSAFGFVQTASADVLSDLLGPGLPVNLAVGTYNLNLVNELLPLGVTVPLHLLGPNVLEIKPIEITGAQAASLPGLP